jgi:hypothetical protein
MEESNVEVFVKEERWPEAILAAVPLPTFLRQRPATSLFLFSTSISVYCEIKSQRYF